MGGDYLDLPVLERERLVFFIVQIELAHSEKQLVWVDAEKRGAQFFWVDRPRTHLSTQWAAVMAQFSLSRAAPHLCRNVAGNKEFSFLGTTRGQTSNKHPGYYEVKQAKHPGYHEVKQASWSPVLHWRRDTCQGHSPYLASSPFTILPRLECEFPQRPCASLVVLCPPIILPPRGVAWEDLLKVWFNHGRLPQMSRKGIVLKSGQPVGFVVVGVSVVVLLLSRTDCGVVDAFSVVVVVVEKLSKQSLIFEGSESVLHASSSGGDSLGGDGPSTTVQL